MIEIIEKYIINNSLYIDKSIYITVVIGQLTIYGILLTFYQFITSYENGGKRTARKYLGKRITEYYVSQKTWLYKIVRNKFFVIVFLVEILTKPVINVFGYYFSNITTSIIYFAWYMFVVCYFLIFMLLFCQCTTCVIKLKSISDIMQNKEIMSKINEEFLRTRKFKSYNGKSIDILMDVFANLKYVIMFDDEPILLDNYDNLFIKLIDEYCFQKEKEIDLIRKKKKIVKNQIAFSYNDSCEQNLFNDLVHNKYIKLDNKLQKYIAQKHLHFKYLNIIREQLSEFKSCYNISQEDDWKDISKYIYDNYSINVKKYLVSRLCDYINDKETPDDFIDYCEEVLYWIIYNSISNICKGSDEEEFYGIIKSYMHNAKLRELITDILLEFVISYDRFSPSKLIELLEEKNKIYIFLFLIIYYSIYSFRFNWKFINLDLLKKLIYKVDINNIDREYVLEKIGGSNINHRFDNKMLDVLVLYLRNDLSRELIAKMIQDNLINVFYIISIKTCIFDQSNPTYCIDEMTLEQQIEFVCFMSEHTELLNNKNIEKIIYRLRWETFSKIDVIPEKLLNTFKGMLLADVEIKETFFDDIRTNYINVNNIGRYALVKLSDSNKTWPKMQESIKKSYISSNCSIEDYISEIEKVTSHCSFPISYVQKERMKQYLFGLL